MYTEKERAKLLIQAATAVSTYPEVEGMDPRPLMECAVHMLASSIIEVAEDGTIRHVEFVGGCHGNLQGISRLVEGMPVEEAIRRLDGIRCGGKPTSCPDQLAQALKQYKGE